MYYVLLVKFITITNCNVYLLIDLQMNRLIFSPFMRELPLFCAFCYFNEGYYWTVYSLHCTLPLIWKVKSQKITWQVRTNGIFTCMIQLCKYVIYSYFLSKTLNTIHKFKKRRKKAKYDILHSFLFSCKNVHYLSFHKGNFLLS